MNRPAPKALHAFVFVTTRGHGIVEAVDFNQAAAKLERRIPIDSLLWLAEAGPTDIEYARANGGSLPRKYRSTTEVP